MVKDMTAGDLASWATATEFVPQGLPLGPRTVPAEPGIHLWYFDLGELWQKLSGALAGEDVSDSQGVGAMTMPQLRFARRFYLRMLLGAYLGIPGKDVTMSAGPRGKPVLDTERHGQGLHFSLAKSGNRMLIGIAGDFEIGVDLESKDRKPRDALRLASRFFTARESEAVRQLAVAERDAEFMRIWACKEAVAKASGHGIANRFCRFSVRADRYSTPVVTDDPDLTADGWKLALFLPEDGFLAAVASRQSGMELQAFRVAGH